MGSHKGISEETRKKMSFAHAGGMHHLSGKHQSATTKERISKTLTKEIRKGPQGEDLPRYIGYVNWKDRKGYVVIGHPKLGSRRKYFVSGKKSLDQLLKEIVNFVTSLDEK